jgi:uncharacterized ferritin-like protein (DUF455 family)
MELRSTALHLLQGQDPVLLVQSMHSMWSQRGEWRVDPDDQFTHPPGPFPGRPPRPRLCPPQNVPSRSVHTTHGLAGMVHAICHIEFNAIHLALDAIWRFPGLPEAYYRDWWQVAYEESTHFQKLHQLLQHMGHVYGDFDAHDGLWQMCEKTAHDVIARMALVPRTLEARGLDATPIIQTKLALTDSPFASEFKAILDIILRDEIGHVAVGNRWYRWLCEQHQLDPLTHYPALVQRHTAPRLKPPFNQQARLDAGFTQEEIDWLLAQSLA